MVVPIIIGVGVTMMALLTRSGIRAWGAYKLLTPAQIAKMNGIILYSNTFSNSDRRFQSNLISESLKRQLNKYQGGFNTPMTEAEALMILNISSDEINRLDQSMLKKKHRFAMIKNHPDRGGSPYVAQKVNEAKDMIANSYMMRK